MLALLQRQVLILDRSKFVCILLTRGEIELI